MSNSCQEYITFIVAGRDLKQRSHASNEQKETISKDEHIAYLNSISSRIIQSQFPKRNGYVRGRTVGPSVDERHCVRVVDALDRQDRTGPDLDTSVL